MLMHIITLSDCTLYWTWFMKPHPDIEAHSGYIYI